MTTRNCIVALGLGALFSVSARGEEAVVKTTLAAVQAQPHAFYKTSFEVEARFDKLAEIYQPFFTVFDDHRHVNFAAWDTGRNLALRSEFVGSCPLLYMQRQKADAIENLFALKRFQRFKAVGTVQSIFGGHAFIEFSDLIPLDQEMCEKEHFAQASSPEQIAKELMAIEAAKAAQEADGIVETAELAADPRMKNPAPQAAEGNAEPQAADEPANMPPAADAPPAAEPASQHDTQGN